MSLKRCVDNCIVLLDYTNVYVIIKTLNLKVFMYRVEDL